MGSLLLSVSSSFTTSLPFPFNAPSPTLPPPYPSFPLAITHKTTAKLTYYYSQDMSMRGSDHVPNHIIIGPINIYFQCCGKEIEKVRFVAQSAESCPGANPHSKTMRLRNGREATPVASTERLLRREGRDRRRHRARRRAGHLLPDGHTDGARRRLRPYGQEYRTHRVEGLLAVDERP